ncbi:integrin beta-1-like [Acanthaster planci]|uniref:Integrin beta n=1 Tax=Acanthaster planci TaxID=133434 RepID=A0A8B7XR18_ACAPL|nr:integrin beta-1-like [Acanthaster planci]XP_022083299.1 integrin beta-1-like [Acanthaster planci]XP_022083308.1 integrin beta-1-like [Acanthaster planci]XP_022083314.1 integrin beta-1-like [Acanthaster planci]XP_022083323.1 integrin beta-1-like [Acanthaster planci]
MDKMTRYRQWMWVGITLSLLSTMCTMQASAQDAQNLDDNPCSEASSCGDCISLDPRCAWCEDQGYAEETNYPRCDLITSLTNNSLCQDIAFPQTAVAVEQNDPLSDAGEGPSTEAVQVAPQRIKLKLRPKETANLRVSVRQARDYPVDLYYVMDLSRSMQDDLDNLKDLAKILAQEMGNITRNFRLGFGSFVEKTVAPFINTAPESLQQPCPGCEAPYNFRNHLPLDVNTDLFSVKVNETSVSGNLDRPEAGLDALMQVTVCKDQIGWLPRARHIVVYTSDDAFHFAGDGKLGGVVQPNNGECHLDPVTGYNTKANEYDYPSIGHLNFRMREQNVIPIFAVTSTNVHLYQNLAHFIEGSTVGTLAVDSSNVVDLIKDNYATITSRVEIVDNAPENLAVRYVSRCLNEAPRPDSRVCTGLRLGETVSFDVSVEATGCPETEIQKFSIRPIGFDESVEIIVEVACNCECEAFGIPNSEYCTNGNGTLSCGQCACNAGRYGKLCECSGMEDAGTFFRDKNENTASCRANANATSSVVCSGRGECICGECVCFERQNANEIISGRHCECDNFSCERHNSELCGGLDRGECVCDEKRRRSACKCRPGYVGNACGCSTSTTACLASNGLICNGRGRCNCNECTCDSPFQGDTCEVCKTCIGKCSSYRPCVECQVYGVDISPAECSKCNVAVVIEKELPTVNGSSPCVFPVPEGSNNCSLTYSFVYETLNNGTILVHFEEPKECTGGDGGGSGTDGKGPIIEKDASGSEILIFVVSTVAVIVLIGILLLALLKAVNVVRDKREYDRFQKEQKNAVWEQAQNPIYKQATSTFINPTYGK